MELRVSLAGTMGGTGTFRLAGGTGTIQFCTIVVVTVTVTVTIMMPMPSGGPDRHRDSLRVTVRQAAGIRDTCSFKFNGASSWCTRVSRAYRPASAAGTAPRRGQAPMAVVTSPGRVPAITEKALTHERRGLLSSAPSKWKRCNASDGSDPTEAKTNYVMSVLICVANSVS